MKNKVSNLQQFQERSEELRSAGYVAVKPGRYLSRHSEGKTMTWNELIRQQIYSAEARQDSSGKRHISTLFASSGGENKGVPENVGTKGLGFMEWGLGNNLPNKITLLSEMSPFVISGWDFIKKLLAARGPKPMYSYTQYVGGNITQKSIPFKDAGILLRGQIRDLKRAAATTVPEGSPSVTSSVPTAEAGGTDDEDLRLLEEAYQNWRDTWEGNEEKGIYSLRAFLEANNLHQTYLEMAGDMAMMNQCFVEVQLNQGKATPTSLWKPFVVGLKHRSNFTTRLERMDKNYKINYAYMSNRWLESYGQSSEMTFDEITAIPFLGFNNETGEIESHVRRARQLNRKRKERPTRFMMTCRDTTTGRSYYAESPWHSIFAGDIFEYATTIVSDRLTRKHNSNIIGRVIYVHQTYLETLFRQQPQGDKAKTMEELQDEVFNDINDWLSNPDNAGQALIASTFTAPDGHTQLKAWEIVEIESHSSDQAEADKSELQEITSIIFFAMGLDSKLIGNTPGDATSSGGTDIRERYLVKGVQFAPLQQLMLRPLEVASRYNQWDEHLQWEIEREVLTTLDNSKTGVTKSTTRSE